MDMILPFLKSFVFVHYLVIFLVYGKLFALNVENRISYI